MGTSDCHGRATAVVLNRGQEKANGGYSICTARDIRIRDVILTGRSGVAGIRRIGHAPVRFSLQLRALDGAQFERCRGSRTRDLSQGLTRFRVVSAWYQFPGMDVSNPRKHLSKFALKTRPTHDRGDGFGGGWT